MEMRNKIMQITPKFQFTLVLENVDEHSNDLEDILYEAGCDDALISTKNGTVFLGFDREATSLEEAIISAIKNLHSKKIQVAGIAPDTLVTESKITIRKSVSKREDIEEVSLDQLRAEFRAEREKLTKLNKKKSNKK